MENSSDEEIVRAITGGNKELFRVILNRYQNRIYSIGIRFYRNSDDASDFVQEVFLKCYQSLEGFRGDSPFRYWFIRLAYNHGINGIKKIRDEIGADELELMANTETPQELYAKQEVSSLLSKAVEKLPQGYQVCIDLSFYWGMTYRQIENITSIPVNTIKSNIMRGKKILRNILKGTIAEEYDE